MYNLKYNLIILGNMKKLLLSLLLPVSFIALSGCSNNSANESNKYNTEAIHQVSLLQGLMLGDYYGSVTVKELKSMGNTGIGTFNSLNGELILIDGICFRANESLELEVVSDDETVPFADVTFLDNDLSYELNGLNSIEELKSTLDNKVKELGTNRFYMIRIDGLFNEIYFRSEKKQSLPYKPLNEVLKTDQTFKTMTNTNGSIVGLYTPNYMSDLNAVGWHFHFVTEDRRSGGHVLNADLGECNITWDYTDSFNMYLPDGEFFKTLDLTVDQDDAIKEVEQGN